MRAALISGVLVLTSVAGCANLGLQPAALPPNLDETLERCGEVFTPMIAPPGIVTAEAVVQRLRSGGFPPFAPPNSRVATPVYGVLADGKPSECRGDGFTRPGEQLAIWLVVWPDVSGGNGGQAWAIVDARTGEFIVGDGPPGG